MTSSPKPQPGSGLKLIDSFGRVHNNLRISVTDRCNIRCFYCMPAESVQFMDRKDLLTFEEIERVAGIGTTLGIDRIRLTGGEPLVRRDLPVLVEKLVRLPGIRDVGLTTNGILLKQQVRELRDAGLGRVNISLDALSADKFQEITRREGFEQVLEGIQSAIDAGLDPVKINAVAIRNLTENEIVRFGEFARESGVEVRFIEFMPLDADNAWEREKVLFGHEIIQKLSESIMPLRLLESPDLQAPASQFEFEDGRGRIGLIASVSQPFCRTCNRFRLTADGKLRNCLFSLDEYDVRTLLRGDAGDEQIAALMQEAISAKKEGHEINTARFVQPDRPMYSIGG